MPNRILCIPLLRYTRLSFWLGPVVDDDEQKSSQDSEEEDSNFVLILGIAGVGIVLILFGAIAVLIRKKPKIKSKILKGCSSIFGG